MSDLPRQIAERAIRFLESPPGGDDPVLTWRSPEDVAATFDASVPIDLGAPVPASAPADLLKAVDEVLRLSVRTSHPRFVNQNFAGPDPIAVVGDWLAAALNTTNATFEVAPVFTLMERAVLDRLARFIGFRTEEHTSSLTSGLAAGLFCPGGSMATLYAMQLARFRHDPDVVRRGQRTEYAVFVSKSGHYAARKAAALMGMGMDAVVQVATDASGAMLPSALDAAMNDARAAGREPLVVVATSGTTVTAAFDPLDAIAALTEKAGVWLHVDGCYGASALFSPRTRHLMAGVERADSVAWNLHKMMGMTQQCSTLLLRDPEALGPCFAVKANYIFQHDKLHGDLDAGDKTFQCGRRVDVLKAWLSWKAHGDAGFAERVEHAVDRADEVRAAVDASEGELAAVVRGEFTNVCLTWVPPELRPLDLSAISDEDRARLHGLAPRVKALMQQRGSALIGYQPVHELNVFRLLFMNPSVTTEDAQRLVHTVREYSREVWPTIARS